MAHAAVIHKDIQATASQFSDLALTLRDALCISHIKSNGRDSDIRELLQNLRPAPSSDNIEPAGMELFDQGMANSTWCTASDQNRATTL